MIISPIIVFTFDIRHCLSRLCFAFVFHSHSLGSPVAEPRTVFPSVKEVRVTDWPTFRPAVIAQYPHTPYTRDTFPRERSSLSFPRSKGNGKIRTSERDIAKVARQKEGPEPALPVS